MLMYRQKGEGGRVGHKSAPKSIVEPPATTCMQHSVSMPHPTGHSNSAEKTCLHVAIMVRTSSRQETALIPHPRSVPNFTRRCEMSERQKCSKEDTCIIGVPILKKRLMKRPEFQDGDTYHVMCMSGLTMMYTTAMLAIFLLDMASATAEMNGMSGAPVHGVVGINHGLIVTG